MEIGGAGNLMKIIEIQKSCPGSLSLPLPKFSQAEVSNDGENSTFSEGPTGQGPLATAL